MPLPKIESYTTDYIYSLPDGERADLIDGQIYYIAPPSRRHQYILLELAGNIREYIKSRGGSCKPFIAPFAVFLNTDDKNYVEPDICIICSPGSRRMDYSIKLFKYRSAGVREYWIVDPDRNRITVHDLADEDVNEYTFSDTVKGIIFDDLLIDFAQLEL